MRVTWAVCTNLLNPAAVARIKTACEAHGQRFLPFDAIPFSDALPHEVPSDAPAIFYGSARQTILIAQSKRWHPGVFFDEARFTLSAAIAGLGERMLNADATLTTFATLHALPPDTYPDDAPLFLRPEGDDKAFAGGVMRWGELRAWSARLCRLDTTLSPDTPLRLATPKALRREWRLFMRGDDVITGSLYRLDGELCERAEVPEEVSFFARSASALWRPAEAFVIDITETAHGDLKVIEHNGINSSGFYASDMPAIIAALSSLALETWRSSP